MRLAILTQVVTGIRFGELRALRKEDLDLRASGLHIRRSQTRRTISTPKNGKARFQVLPRGLADELKVWMMKTSGQLLFPSERGLPLPNNTLNRAYTKLAEEAGSATHLRLELRGDGRGPEDDRDDARACRYVSHGALHPCAGGRWWRRGGRRSRLKLESDCTEARQLREFSR